MSRTRVEGVPVAEHLLKVFDENVAAARRPIAATSDEAYAKQWSLLSQGQPLATMPRAVVIQVSCSITRSITGRFSVSTSV